MGFEILYLMIGFMEVRLPWYLFMLSISKHGFWLAGGYTASQSGLARQHFIHYIYIYRSHSVNTKIGLLKFHIYISFIFVYI